MPFVEAFFLVLLVIWFSWRLVNWPTFADFLIATEAEINNLFRDQERVRQNISNLNQVSGQQEQVQKYARTLAAQESQLTGLRDRQSDLTQKTAALESELNSLIDKIEF